jgi:hypothetical protein
VKKRRATALARTVDLSGYGERADPAQPDSVHRRDSSMDDHEHEAPKGNRTEASRSEGSENASEDQTDQSTISTADATVASGADHDAEWRNHPEATLITETGRADHTMPPYLLLNAGVSPSQSREDHSHRERGEKASHKITHGGDTDRLAESDGDQRKTRTSSWRNVLISAGVAVVAGMAGSGAVLYFFGPSRSESKQSSGNEQSGSQKNGGSQNKSQSKESGKDADKGAGADETAQAGSTIPGFTRANDADTLRSQIEHLSERIDQLGHRLDTQSREREQVPPDLRTLQIKVGDLTRTMEEVGTVPSRFRRLESRFDDLQQELKALRDRMSSSDDRPVAWLDSKSIPPSVSISPPRTAESEPDAAWAQAVALFRTGHYSEARNVFRLLQVTRPDDARVWYYSALAIGLTTGDWSRSARELAEHGVECERAGTPERNQIDAAFSGLTDAQGRIWLREYRAKASVR